MKRNRKTLLNIQHIEESMNNVTMLDLERTQATTSPIKNHWLSCGAPDTPPEPQATISYQITTKLSAVCQIHWNTSQKTRCKKNRNISMHPHKLGLVSTCQTFKLNH